MALQPRIRYRSSSYLNFKLTHYLSVKAGLHRNFLTQLMADDWREPQFGNVVKICRAIGVSITYIVTGAELTQEQEVLLSHLARISPEQQRSVLALLESFPPNGARIQ